MEGCHQGSAEVRGHPAGINPLSYHVGVRTELVFLDLVIGTFPPDMSRQPLLQFKDFIYVYECFAHVYMHITCLQCLHSPEEGPESPGTGVTVGSEQETKPCSSVRAISAAHC